MTNDPTAYLLVETDGSLIVCVSAYRAPGSDLTHVASTVGMTVCGESAQAMEEVLRDYVTCPACGDLLIQQNMARATTVPLAEAAQRAATDQAEAMLREAHINPPTDVQ